MIDILKLSNGMPVIRCPIAGTEATTLMVSYAAGSRAETPEENGAAHFLEHLVFKGGEAYPDYRAVNHRADQIGAGLNAYTSKDIVSFYLTLHSSQSRDGLDLLSDFVGRPRIPEAEMNVERGVVIQEIARSDDQPSMAASTLIDRAAYGDTPLGRRILGTREIISAITREEVLAFRERAWRSGNAVLLVIGKTDDLNIDDLNELGQRLPVPSNPSALAEVSLGAPQRLVSQTDSQQSHLRMAWEMEGIDPFDRGQRAALQVYNQLLGGMMSSRLFDEIREQRGLCYSVGSSPYFFVDNTHLHVSSGLKSDLLAAAMTRIEEIVVELANEGPSVEEVERARNSRIGMLSRTFESSKSVARALANSYVVYDQALDPQLIIDEARGVQLQDVIEIAGRVAEQPSIAIVGPHDPEQFGATAA